MPPFMRRSTQDASDALTRLIRLAWRKEGRDGTIESCFSIPTNQAKDADCILSDVLDERDHLRATLEAVATRSEKGFTACAMCHYVAEAGHRLDCIVGQSLRWPEALAEPQL